MSQSMHPAMRSPRGYTLIELMIVIAIAVMLMSLALPAYQDYSIREKTTEALNLASVAKSVLTSTCQMDMDKKVTQNGDAGYYFTETFGEHSYVANIQVQANCATGTMWIWIKTKNTGAGTDPQLYLFTDNAWFTKLGDLIDSESYQWECYGDAESETHLPATCKPREDAYTQDLTDV